MYICNAYKDFTIYNENMVIVGHQKKDGPLKTDESYRHIHIVARLKENLLAHKKKQQETFRLLGKVWSENCYVFYNTKYEPYTPERITRHMFELVERNKLEHMTVYGLRHSFATFYAENGMYESVLAMIMGHSDPSTTKKYYIHISEKRKRLEMLKADNNNIAKMELEQSGVAPELIPQNTNNVTSKDVAMIMMQINNNFINIIKPALLEQQQKEIVEVKTNTQEIKMIVPKKFKRTILNRIILAPKVS